MWLALLVLLFCLVGAYYGAWRHLLPHRPSRISLSTPVAPPGPGSGPVVVGSGPLLTQAKSRFKWFKRGGSVDLQSLILEVASRLDSGADQLSTWSNTLARHNLSPPKTESELNGQNLWNSLNSQVTADQRAALSGICVAVDYSKNLGAPLSEVLADVSEGISQSVEAAKSRRLALAGPKTSAMILFFLPLIGIGFSLLLGTDPLKVMGDLGLGTLSTLGGILFMLVGTFWTRRLLTDATVHPPVGQTGYARPETWILLDLALAGLKSGNSIPRLLGALGDALHLLELVYVGNALLLGSNWDNAWQLLPDEQWCRSLSNALQPAWQDGIDPAALLKAGAQSSMREKDTVAQELAGKLAVRLVLPLGLCYLPAFVLVGVIPIVLSTLGTLKG